MAGDVPSRLVRREQQHPTDVWRTRKKVRASQNLFLSLKIDVRLMSVFSKFYRRTMVGQLDLLWIHVPRHLSWRKSRLVLADPPTCFFIQRSLPGYRHKMV